MTISVNATGDDPESYIRQARRVADEVNETHDCEPDGGVSEVSGQYLSLALAKFATALNDLRSAVGVTTEGMGRAIDQVANGFLTVDDQAATALESGQAYVNDVQIVQPAQGDESSGAKPSTGSKARVF